MAEINALDLLGAGEDEERYVVPKEEEEYCDEITIKEESHEEAGGSQLAPNEGEHQPVTYDSGGVSAHLLLGDDGEEEEENPEISEDVKPSIDLYSDEQPEFSGAEYSEDLVEAKQERSGQEILASFNVLRSQDCTECGQRVSWSSKEIEWTEKCEHILSHIPIITFGCGRCRVRSKAKIDVFMHMKKIHGGTIFYPAVTHGNAYDQDIIHRLLQDCFPGTHIRSLMQPPNSKPSLHYMVAIPDIEKVRNWIMNRFGGETPSRGMKVSTNANYVRKSKNNRIKCTSCQTLISGGPMEWKLKCEHAMTHMNLKWLVCIQCPGASFASDDAFWNHMKVMHPGSTPNGLKKKLEIDQPMLNAVETLVKRLFPGSVKPDDSNLPSEPVKVPRTRKRKNTSQVTITEGAPLSLNDLETSPSVTYSSNGTRTYGLEDVKPNVSDFQ